MAFIDWMPALDYADLRRNPGLVPVWNGFYVFALDSNAPREDRVLYVGECNRVGGFRARFADYLDPDPASGTTRHKGALFLQDFWMKNPNTPIFVHFAPLDTDKQTRRDIEAAMMQYFKAWFNSRDMQAETPFDTL
jgi:hypothetical protein